MILWNIEGEDWKINKKDESKRKEKWRLKLKIFDFFEKEIRIIRIDEIY